MAIACSITNSRLLITLLLSPSQAPTRGLFQHQRDISPTGRSDSWLSPRSENVGSCKQIGAMCQCSSESPTSKVVNQTTRFRKPMNLSFENRVALVTGAASGMGLATAKAFAEAGAAVVLADFKEDAVKAEAQKLVAAGHKAIGIRCNVADEAEVAAMVTQTISTFGRLAAAFNNVGVMR